MKIPEGISDQVLHRSLKNPQEDWKSLMESQERKEIVEWISAGITGVVSQKIQEIFEKNRRMIFNEIWKRFSEKLHGKTFKVIPE